MNHKTSQFTKHCRDLVKSVTNFDEKDDNFQICVDFAASNLLYHSYPEVNIFAVKKRIARFHEKFLVHSELAKAREFQNVTEKLINIFDKQNGTLREVGYGVLLLLLNLSESSDTEWKSSNPQVSNTVREESWQFDWASYLQEDSINSNSLSDSSSEISLSEQGSANEFPTSEDDSLENLPDLQLRPPPRDDSGLGISPDSSSGASQHFHGATLQLENTSLVPKAERNSQTFYPYWMVKYQRMYGSSPYNLKNMNFTKIWNEYIMEQNLLPFIEKKVILHERNVIKEILWMLSGVKDLFVAHWNGQKFCFNSHLHLSNLTSKTLGVVLGEFCEFATKKATVQDFLWNVLMDASQHCLTYQAYAWSMQEHLQKINAIICNLDQRLRKGFENDEIFTLLSLKNEMKPILHEIDFLYHIHCETSSEISLDNEPVVVATQLLHTLWKLLHHQSLIDHKSTSLKIILKIFLKTCRPYFSFLEEMIILGSFKDPYGEFIVKRGDLNASDKTFWDSGFSFRPIPSDIEEEFFLKPILADVLSAGKSLEIMNTINSLSKRKPFRLHAEKDDMYSKFIKVLKTLICKRKVRRKPPLCPPNAQDKRFALYISKDPMLEQKIFSFNPTTSKFFLPDVNPMYRVVSQKVPESLFSERHKALFRSIEEIEPESLKSLSKSVHKALETCMAFAYYPVCKRLIQSLKDDYKVLTHLNVMKKYFLMTSGDLMFSFYSKVFTKIFYKQHWLDASILYYHLQDAISVDKENSSKLCIFVEENSEINVKQPLSHLNALRLSYKVEWPVSMMLGNDVQEKYNSIFTFLLQIKCAKYLLDSLYNTDLCKKQQNQLALRKFTQRSEFPREQKMHGMYIIRMRLMFFVNGLHNYIMTRILHSYDSEFMEVVENSRTVDEMMSAHSVYLKCLQERCLLDKRIAYLREHIVEVLNLCHRFQQMWIGGIDGVCLEDLQLMENQFSKYSDFLLSSFNAPLRRGTYLHWDQHGAWDLVPLCFRRRFASDIRVAVPPDQEPSVYLFLSIFIFFVYCHWISLI